MAKDKLNATKQKLFSSKTNYSQTADDMVLIINSCEIYMDNLKEVCDNVLQKVRDHYGKE